MKALQFFPPPVDSTPELRWVLLRAFGPARAPWNEPLDSEEIARLAGAFDLVSRIAGRTGKKLLSQEIGGGLSEKWLHAYRLTAASALQFQAVARQLARTANEAGIPVAFLKGTALGLGSVVPIGFRGACDVDMLVPPRRLEELKNSLCTQGFVTSDLPDHEHQAPPMFHPSGVMLELHRHIPGVRLRGQRRFVTIADLENHGLLEKAPALGDGAFIPARTVLAAHCLVHGFVQHGMAPGSYPAFRAIADLVDLGFDAAEAPSTALQMDQFDDDAVKAVRLLVAGLVGGAADLFVGENPQSRIVRHLIVGATDATYREAMKASPRSMLGLSEKSLPLELLSIVAHAVFVSRAQIDIIYGRPKSRWGYAVRQVFRPFDLILRAVRYKAAAMRVKVRNTV